MSKPGVLSLLRNIINEFRGYGMKEFEQIQAKKAALKSAMAELELRRKEERAQQEAATLAALRATINEMKKIDEQMDRQGKAMEAMFDEMQRATQQMMEEKMKQQQQLARKVAQQVAKSGDTKDMDSLLEATLGNETTPKPETNRDQTTKP
uniref:Uncharacterized protein n=1 Tax=Pyramimonas obovata TaxID=1411642 RepID=A0A7S0R7A3_9CHLO|mmetsp:Transcript_2720/g.5625  ORF Transcript_2720/g.5625 Transcript_2720/m.5625 type:complete len:151 (+) Transcript_2720:203-655(+)|eukprot:CAMPEP_0118928346 /NCGR_PEP_ID=MMETSP1169-20130426/5620_1 /TAXON_ID=36882 /ORGANISM="Pyramimonas obovata, Strain CCMP722" /LENGTH=150 /DNA_ID=CAMNT_0006870295 /DNA_START=156 /DNA_END=608 /DNA_ORIENTATION=-